MPALSGEGKDKSLKMADLAGQHHVTTVLQSCHCVLTSREHFLNSTFSFK